ncbi:MAG: DUF2723 domain-containing protein [Prevotellaceae bacterium]|nr:DUF2723 domain-containing protein [Prevotellaceae bacterium]
MRFKLINNIAGWCVFAIAAAVYLLTIEPSSSLWDCGEFTATSYKLEVGHPPGASIFMLVARAFTLFASSPESVAMMVNIMSALCSAFCILFLFWSITHLARRMYGGKDELNISETVATLGAGLAGALAYTFSDTFWFSAVESEVYAMSSLFTALVFWSMLKWEEEADKAGAGRWIVLVAYLIGLSIGVHLLNLLAIPAMVFVFYFRRYKVTTKGVVLTLLISILILGFVIWGVIPGVPRLASYFELLFVNTFGLPYNSGLVFYVFASMAALAAVVWYTRIRKKVLMNTLALCLTMIVLGYFSLAAIVIRSDANTPINENDPSNVFSLLSYLNREQYGDHPLISGESFASPPAPANKIEDIAINKRIYDKVNGRYEAREIFNGYRTDPRYNMFLPRLFSRQPGHFEQYVKWADMKGMASTEQGFSRMPTSAENFRFMLNYQFGWMYFRYFMWNFAGRQNDVQGRDGNPTEGNWISGISFIDRARLGVDMDKFPDNLKENKARNEYYMIPLILGLLGMCFHFRRDRKNCFIVALLFIFTGIAIAFYLNIPPNQPRERDYVFAGSFYAFAVWIGFAVLSIFEFARRQRGLKPLPAAAAATLLCMSAPCIMAMQNWDDHDRSNRYIARDIAWNYLATVEGRDGILFTFGDNDTFPLWYSQEVEGNRPDLRIVNMSLLYGEWYIDQMKNRIYESSPLPILMPKSAYKEGVNGDISVHDLIKDTLTARQIIDFVCNPANADKRSGDNYIPCRNFKIPVDKASVLQHGIVAAKDSALIDDYIYLKFTGNHILRSELAVLDVLSNYKWDRPIYSTSASDAIGLGQGPYMRYDGFAYKFVPIRNHLYKDDASSDGNHNHIDTETLYHNLMNKYRWGNMNTPGVLVDHHAMVSLMMTLDIRGMFCSLADRLIDEEKTDKAIEVLDRALELTPRRPFFYNITYPPHDLSVTNIIEAYCRAGAIEKGKALFDEFLAETKTCIAFYASTLNNAGRHYGVMYYSFGINIDYIRILNSIAQNYGLDDKAAELGELFARYAALLQRRQR